MNRSAGSEHSPALLGAESVPGFGSKIPPQRLAAILTLGGFAVSLTLAFASDGAYHDDDICHYLFARDAWTSADALLHWWARPGYNLPAMVAARFFGLLGCRVLSGLMTALVAWLAWLVARRLPISPRTAALAPALVWLQPLTMTLSFTTLTETPAALYCILALWLMLRGNRLGGCAVFSLLFVTRLECAALLPVPLLFFAFKDSTSHGNSMLGLENPSRSRNRYRMPEQGCYRSDLGERDDANLNERRENGLLPHGSERLSLSPNPPSSLTVGAPYEASRRRFAEFPWRQVFSRQSWACLATLLWAPVAWIAASHLAQVTPGASVLHLFSRGYSTEYGRGPLWHFLGVWPEAASYGLAALALAGGVVLGRSGALLSLAAGAFLVLQSLLFALGVFASGGYARFLVVLAGPTAVLAVAALSRVWNGGPISRCAASLFPGSLAVLVAATTLVRPIAAPAALWGLALACLACAVGALLSPPARRAQLARAFAAACLALAALQAALLVRPLDLGATPLNALVREAARFASRSPYATQTMISQHVAGEYVRGEKARHAGDNGEALRLWEDSPAGTLFLWENKYCEKMHTPEDRRSTARLWDSLQREGRVVFSGQREGWSVILFERALPVD